MLSARAEAKDARPVRFAAAAPSPVVIAEFADLLASAQRPLMIIGGPGWSTTVEARINSIAERFDLPVAAAFRFQDYMDNRHPCYVGHAGIGIDAKLAAAVRDADVLIVLGARLGEMTTSGYTLIEIPNPAQRLVHIHPDPDELGTVYAPGLPISATAAQFSAALDALKPPADIPWKQRRADLKAAYEAALRPIATPSAVQLEQVVRSVSDILPEDGIVTNGAGNYAAFVHRYFQYKGF